MRDLLAIEVLESADFLHGLEAEEMMGAACVDSAVGRQRARECLAYLNVPPVGWSALWAASDDATRRMLLRLVEGDPGMWGRAWLALPESVRDAIQGRAPALRDWLLRVLPL